MVLFVTTTLLVAGWAGLPARGEIWLTPAEQKFIAALGLDARIDGKTCHREPNYESLVEIGNGASEPLKSRILALAKAYPKLRLSQEQTEEFQALLLSAATEAQAQISKMALEGLANPKLTEQERTEKSAKAINALLANEKGPFRTATRKATDRYREEAEALETVAKEMDLVTADFEKRVGRTRPASDLSLSLGTEKGALVITGKVGSTPLTAAVMQVVMHKAKANGSWQALDQSMSLLLQSMGVSNMSALPGKAGLESKAQAEALEKSFNLPIVKTFGLPKLSPGSRLTIVLDEDLNDVIFFERVSLKAWTAEGTIALDSIPSVESVQKLREELPRGERFIDTANQKAPEQPASTAAKPDARSASRTSEAPSAVPIPPLFGGGNLIPDPDRKSPGQDAKSRARRQAAQEQQAVAALNLARSALKRKQNNEALVYLNQVIALAPDSRAAETARKLIKELDN